MANGTFGYRTDRAGGVKVEGLASVQRQLRKLSDDVDYQANEFLSTNKAIASAVAGDTTWCGAARDSSWRFPAASIVAAPESCDTRTPWNAMRRRA